MAEESSARLGVQAKEKARELGIDLSVIEPAISAPETPRLGGRRGLSKIGGEGWGLSYRKDKLIQ